MKQLSILGSTGSIGRQCLSVVESLPGRFGVVALAAGSNLEELTGQVERHQPEVVSVADAGRTDELSRLLRGKGISPLPELHHGREGMLAVGTHANADMVVSAAVGVVGLEATFGGWPSLAPHLEREVHPGRPLLVAALRRVHVLELEWLFVQGLGLALALPLPRRGSLPSRWSFPPGAASRSAKLDGLFQHRAHSTDSEP